MTKTLILNSLDICRFRAFRHLRIERLGRVNLIVGKNNVGKTCLLEALALYASRGSLLLMQELLEARDETSPLPVRNAVDTEGQNIRHLFFGRSDLEVQNETIHIGPIDAQADTLIIGVAWFVDRIDQDGQRQLQMLQPADYDAVDVRIPGLGIRIGNKLHMQYPLDQAISSMRRGLRPKAQFEGIVYSFIPANGLGKEQSSRLWDSIALTDLEQDVLASLRIIAPKVVRVNLVGSTEHSQERIPMVRTADRADPLPLRSLGEGMNRLFGLALALVNAKQGILLVDEVDSGLYYSVQPDLWRLIFEVARRLNVQVFATTHSWDCVEAFQKAIQQDPQKDGLLISLRDKEGEPGHVVAVLFDESELAIVTREQIEVR